MAIQDKPLKEIFKDIRNTIKETLETHADLKDIRRVIYGEQVRIGALKTPTIWVVPEPYTPTLSGGHTAQHDICFNFVVLVKDNDPEEGLERAQDLAMTLYDVMAEDRTLNGLVSDVRPTSIDPAYEMGQSTQVYWSSVQFDFRLKRRE